MTTATLWVYAHPSEGERLTPHLDPTCELGVGKVAAAGALAVALTHHRFEAVIALGVCGVFPQRHLGDAGRAPAVGDVCIVGEERLADDGIVTEHGFVDLQAMGLGSVGPWRSGSALLSRLRAALPHAPVVAGATVSTGSGTDASSAAIAGRTGALVETMEGAAIASVCTRLGVTWGQVRVVSNETGDRERGGWALGPALDRLEAVAQGLGRVFAG